MKEKMKIDENQYVIVRSGYCGVFAGYIVERFFNNSTIVMRNARRIYEWHGSATLSELAVVGTFLPNSCKFPIEVSMVEINEVAEVIYCTEAGRISIQSVPIWTAKPTDKG